MIIILTCNDVSYIIILKPFNSENHEIHIDYIEDIAKNITNT